MAIDSVFSDSSRVFRRYLGGYQLVCGGACFVALFGPIEASKPLKNYFEKDRALMRRFQRVTVDEPSAEVTIDILHGLKKYYDFAATFELNSLHYTGESGIKVKIFSLSLDTPGRHELLGAL